jgi:hypothetical protein
LEEVEQPAIEEEREGLGRERSQNLEKRKEEVNRRKIKRKI